jgi:hypothetical protein
VARSSQANHRWPALTRIEARWTEERSLNSCVGMNFATMYTLQVHYSQSSFHLP